MYHGLVGKAKYLWGPHRSKYKSLTGGRHYAQKGLKLRLEARIEETVAVFEHKDLHAHERYLVAHDKVQHATRCCYQYVTATGEFMKLL